MSKKIEQWEKEIEICKENIQTQKDKIKELQKKINIEEAREKEANNKLIADTVRKIYGEVNEENIDKFISMLNANGHRLNGGTERE